MSSKGAQAQSSVSGGAQLRQLTPQDVGSLFDGRYTDIEVLSDGTLREIVRDGSPRDENVTRTLKTERTWY